MGIAFSCPGADIFDEGFEALIVRSISFNGKTDKSSLRSFSFNGRDSEPTIFKGFGSGKFIIEGSLDLEKKEMEISIKSPSSEKDTSPTSGGYKKSRFGHSNESVPLSPVIGADSSMHIAAVKLQKVYKSFRTRRQLADCAVIVEQRWWKLLDFALLNSSSISFFDIEKPETAISRWSRARTRAAKVGKGLSKDEKAQKLALQHWLEAIDPRHRYGHNLSFYYDSWLQCASYQPFFYWLDVGEGKEVNLEEQCARSKLQQQCIKYLGPNEREAYEVVVEDGKFMYKSSKQLLDTTGSSKDTKWIFVLSTTKTLYVSQKIKGVFQHSSFLAGGATSAAGRIVVENGILKAVWPHSGHYRPTKENFQEFMSFLKEHKVDVTEVKKAPVEDEEEPTFIMDEMEEDLAERNQPEKMEGKGKKSRAPEGLRNLEIPERINPFGECKLVVSSCPVRPRISKGKRMAMKKRTKENVVEENEEAVAVAGGGGGGGGGGPSSCMFRKQNLFLEELEEEDEVYVPQEWILSRISSRKEMNSYQLGNKLSFKWTTGAGPRIGCVRDFPSAMQFRALEQVSLSPRTTAAAAAGPKCHPSPRIPVSPFFPKPHDVASTKEEMIKRQQ